MPNRIIKESIRGSDDLASVSPEAERLFWRLVVSVDDFGRFDARPKTIVGQCLTAFLGDISEEQVEGWLLELERVGIVELYTVEDRPFLVLTKWGRHQRVRAKDSKFPSPEESRGHSLSFDDKRGHSLSDENTKNEPKSGDFDGSRTFDSKRGHPRTSASSPGNVNENENVNEFVNGNVNESENGEPHHASLEIHVTRQAVAVAEEPPERHSSSSLDPVFGQVVKLYESEGFGMLSDTVREQLDYLQTEFGSDWLMMAIKEGVLQNKRRMRYVAAILQNWRADGGPRTSDNKSQARSRGAPRAGNSLGSEGTTANGQRDERYSKFYELFPDA